MRSSCALPRTGPPEPRSRARTAVHCPCLGSQIANSGNSRSSALRKRDIGIHGTAGMRADRLMAARVGSELRLSAGSVWRARDAQRGSARWLRSSPNTVAAVAAASRADRAASQTCGPGSGNQLRNAAGVLALTGSGPAGPGRTSVALIANLVALAEAVAEAPGRPDPLCGTVARTAAGKAYCQRQEQVLSHANESELSPACASHLRVPAI
jgi:hypothetical protein